MNDDPDFPAGQTIERDFACVGCQYNLRGLKPEGSCPECGQPIARSIEQSRLLHAGRFEIGRPLRMIFWGALLCILDLKFSFSENGTGLACDLLNDTVGMILITVGVTRLALPVHEHYRKAMKFVTVVAFVGIFISLKQWVVITLPDAVAAALSVMGLISQTAILVFCVSMGWYCQEAGLPAAARSWRTSLYLFGVLLVAPMAIMFMVQLGMLISGRSFHIDLGPAGLLLVLVFIIPVIHLLVSMRRTMGEAEARAGWRAANVLTPGAPVLPPGGGE